MCFVPLRHGLCLDLYCNKSSAISAHPNSINDLFRTLLPNPVASSRLNEILTNFCGRFGVFDAVHVYGFLTPRGKRLDELFSEDEFQPSFVGNGNIILTSLP